VTCSTLSAISRGSVMPAPFHSLDGVVRRKVTVHGRVQGVGFRYAVARAAASRGVAGWVRNRPDGTVEAVFEGEFRAVEALVRLCREGPRGAEVAWADVVEEGPEGLREFEIR
jgi:acylphosphatase